MTIEEYFASTYIEEKAQIEEVIKTITNVLPTFITGVTKDDKGWPYEIKKNVNVSIKKYSASTSSMILFALERLMGIIIDVNGQKNINEKLEEIPRSVRDKIESIVTKECSRLLDEFISTEGKKRNQFISATFGINDIFTLGWSFGALNSYYEHHKEEKDNALVEKIKENLQYLLNEVKKKVENLDEIDKVGFEEGFFGFEEDDSKKSQEHSFPILRAILLYHLIKKKIDTNFGPLKDIEKVKSFLLNKIHSQLSYNEIPHSNFDPSELVFSLEGLLYIDSILELNSISPDLVDRVFKVIKESQSASPYWRPLKPFIYTKQGMGLLPLSVEIANSLLRICFILEKRDVFYFDQYSELFKNYYTWLKSRIVSFPSEEDGIRYSGWHSEHINKQDIIHPWETAQVVHFLLSYSSAMQAQIRRKTLGLSMLPGKKIGYDSDYNQPTFSTYNNFIKDKYESAKLEEGKSDENLQIFESIEKHFITRDQSSEFSMLLYGPPGTGKTTIAEQISAALQWPLITITPSDFLISGGEVVELRAKVIFQTLMEQKNTVILFDEIDRLVLDRDSLFYQEQGDVFQFMTPSMLVKVRNLRKAKNSIFIISTNYADRIDPAIKRVGRVDKQYLVLPKNKFARIKAIVDYVNKKENKDIFTAHFVEKNMENFIKNSCFMIHDELMNALGKAYGKNATGKSADGIAKDMNDAKLEPANISLHSYTSRFKLVEGEKAEFKGIQQPFKEFLMLVYHKLESGFDNDEIIKKHNNLLGAVLTQMIHSKNINDVQEADIDDALGNIFYEDSFLSIKKSLRNLFIELTKKKNQNEE